MTTTRMDNLADFIRKDGTIQNAFGLHCNNVHHLVDRKTLVVEFEGSVAKLGKWRLENAM